MSTTTAVHPVSVPVLEADGVGLRIGGRQVVDRVSLRLQSGSWTALVGPNGAGKSSLMSLLAGVRAPTQGRVTCAGRALADWPARERARRIAWLAQAGEADGEITVRDVVLLGRLPHHGVLGAPSAADHAMTSAVMAECEVAHLAARRLTALSGGERQRALLARALAVDAPVLLLDEPTAHLDAPHQAMLVRALRRRVAAGATVVTVLHDLGLALLADQVLVMAEGRRIAAGSPDDATLRGALEAAFGQAFAIRPLLQAIGPAAQDGEPAALAAGTTPRWLAVPRF